MVGNEKVEIFLQALNIFAISHEFPNQNEIAILKHTVCMKMPLNRQENNGNREFNNLRMNYRFKKIALFHCMNFRSQLTHNLRGAWHTLYAMLLSNY